MKLTYPQITVLIESILSLDNLSKQTIGRRFAYRMGFNPGPMGADDGIDGEFYHNGKLCHFQSKLSKHRLDKDEARKYYSDIKAHDAHWSIMLAGCGYKQTFYERLKKHDDLNLDNIYLLTLDDLFSCSPLFEKSVLNVPPLSKLTDINWDDFK